MSLLVADAIGLAAGSLTTTSFLPQVLKIIRHRDTRSISLVMYGAFTVGVALWLAYGFMIGSISVILSNIITFVLASTVLVMKLRFG